MDITVSSSILLNLLLVALLCVSCWSVYWSMYRARTDNPTVKYGQNYQKYGQNYRRPSLALGSVGQSLILALVVVVAACLVVVAAACLVVTLLEPDPSTRLLPFWKSVYQQMMEYEDEPSRLEFLKRTAIAFPDEPMSQEEFEIFQSEFWEFCGTARIEKYEKIAKYFDSHINVNRNQFDNHVNADRSHVIQQDVDSLTEQWK